MIFTNYICKSTKKEWRNQLYCLFLHHYYLSKMKFQFILLILTICALNINAQQKPSINPTGSFTPSTGEVKENVTLFQGSAPIKAIFKANADHNEGWNSYFEWRFTKVGENSPYLVRYEQDTDYTFTSSGITKIVLYAIFVQGTDTVSFTKDYWERNVPITVSISESNLSFPNAFSPNGDGVNDIYKAKDTFRSIVEFHAYIYNRWGQLLYEWTNPSEGWDGKYKGQDVKQGVYFCLVKAKGADGRIFNIKQDVNLLRGYTRP